MKVFAERLKELRESKKLSTRDLAELIGVSKSVISAWENDINGVTDENIVKIAKFFNVPTDYLLGLTD